MFLTVCNLILSPHPLGRSILDEARDQPIPGSFLKTLGTRLVTSLGSHLWNPNLILGPISWNKAWVPSVLLHVDVSITLPPLSVYPSRKVHVSYPYKYCRFQSSFGDLAEKRGLLIKVFVLSFQLCRQTTILEMAREFKSSSTKIH